jgi:myosin heavy subunit
LENVVIKFTTDTTGLEPAIKQLAIMGKITDEDAKKIADMNSQQQKFNSTVEQTSTEFNQWQKAFNGVSDEIKSQVIIEAAKQLGGFTNEAKKGGEQIKTLKSELRSLKEQIASGTLGEKEMKAATSRAAELTDHLGDVQQKIKALSSDTKRIDAVVEAFRGLAAGVAVVQGAMGLLGRDNKELEKTLLKVQSAMALLQGVQELANLATGQGIVKTYALAAAEKVAAVASRVLGVEIAASTALATGGLTLLTGAIVYLITQMDDAGESAEQMAERFAKSLELQVKFTNMAIQLVKDGRQRELLQAKADNVRAMNELNKSLADGITKREEYISRVKILVDSFRQKESEINGKYDKMEADAIKKNNDEKLKKAKEAKDNAEKLAKQEREDLLLERKLLHEAIMREQSKIDKYESDQRQKEKEDAIKKKDDLLEIQDKKNEEELNKTKKHLEEIKKAQQDLNDQLTKAVFETSQMISDTLFTMTSQNIQARQDQELEAIEKRSQKELANKRLTEAQRVKIEERTAREIAIIKRNAWKQQQNADVAQATINGALAITNALSTVKPFPAALIAAGLAAVSAATQIAVIKNQPVPKFAKGVERLNGEGTETSDSIVAMLSKNERVVPADVNNDYFPALSAIHNRKVDHTLANTLLTDLANGNLNISQDFVSTTTIDYDKLGQVFAKNKTSVHVNFDENGINVFQQKSAGRIAYINRKFKLNG